MTGVKNITACALIIGNEVLSGRTADANLNWLALRLTEKGIRLAEARVLPDVEEVIIDAVNECREKYTYVFTTGGIGPTHDDITALCIAKAFGTTLERNAEIVRLLEERIGKDKMNEARLKMADVPVGGSLIPNHVSGVPGFRIGNVFVMAGVPSIMRGMFEGIAGELEEGARMLSRSVIAFLPEGTIADGLNAIQERHPATEIGSYPFRKDGVFGCSLVTRTTDKDELDATVEEIREMIRDLGATPVEENEIDPEDLPAG